MKQIKNFIGITSEESFFFKFISYERKVTLFSNDIIISFEIGKDVYRYNWSSNSSRGLASLYKNSIRVYDAYMKEIDPRENAIMTLCYDYIKYIKAELQ